MKFLFELVVLMTIMSLPELYGRPCARERHEHGTRKKLKTCEIKLLTCETERANIGSSTNTGTPLHNSSNVMLAMEPGNDDQNEPKYTLLINEVNIDNPGPNSNVFVELEVIRRDVNVQSDDGDLFGFLMIVIRGDPLEIVMSIQLGSLIRRINKRFLVLGMKGSGAVDVDLNSIDVESIYGPTQGLPDGDDSPFAIAILYSRLQSILGDVSLEQRDGTYYPTSLSSNERLREIIRDNLVDLVIVGRKTPANHCRFFESLKPTALVDPRFKVLLRDWDGPTPQLGGDLSLSRCCGDKQPIDQDCFRLSAPTPGAENTCNFKRPFYLERIIQRVTSAMEEAIPENSGEGSGECRADYPDVPASRYALVNDHNYAAALQEERDQQMQCAAPQAHGANVEEPDHLSEEDMDVDDDGPPAVVPVFTFDTTKFQYCKRFLPTTKLDEITNPAVSSWLEMIREVGRCRFRCYYCSIYLKDGFRPDEKQPTQVMTTGYYSDNKSRLKSAILDHVNPENKKYFTIHSQAATYVTALKRAKMPQEVKKAKQDAHNAQIGIFRPTMNAMKLSWAELRAEIPFRSHPIFFETVKDLGVNLGTSHSNKEALKFFAQAFSRGFHQRLLKHLTEQDQPFSFVADATTNKNTGYLVCLIQTLEFGQPVLYFWRLIRLTKSESGEDMMADIETAVENDDSIHPGFKGYFKDKMVAFISDRGSPMVGHRRGLIAQLKAYVSPNVKSVSCSAHKTETAIKHALGVVTHPNATPDKQKRYFQRFGDFNNKIYSHYMSRGSKRWAHLQELGEEIGVQTTRIKYHHSIRWSQSKRMAMETLLKDFEVIREDLERTSKGTGESEKKAKKILDIVSDKSFAITLAEFVDMLSISERMLEAFQKQHGLLLEIGETLRQGLKRFELLKTTMGKNLRNFLSKISCPSVCDEGKCNLVQYDSCTKVFYRTLVSNQVSEIHSDAELTDSDNESDDSDDDPSAFVEKLVALEKKDPHAAALGSWRQTLYERIIAELKSLFQVKDVEAFDIFDPMNLIFQCPQANSVNKCGNLENCYKPFRPIHVSDITEAATSKFRRICDFYAVTTALCNARLEEWKRVLNAITTQEKYQFLQADRSASAFWGYAITDHALPWTGDLATIVRKVMVTGQSSASAERAFSIMSRLKSSERSNLADETLDHLMRLRFNGPEKIDDSSMYEYTLEFLRFHKRVDEYDAVTEGEKKQQDGAETIFGSLQRSRIFSSEL